jgi:hypothetical protein
MRSPRREPAPGSGDRSPDPPCAATARPAHRLRPPSRGSSNAQLASLSHQTPLKSYRDKPGATRIHEPSHTEFSHNPASHNGLTHEYAARNFAQLRQKRCQQPRRAHKTRPPDAPTRAQRGRNQPGRLQLSHVPDGLDAERHHVVRWNPVTQIRRRQCGRVPIDVHKSRSHGHSRVGPPRPKHARSPAGS